MLSPTPSPAQTSYLMTGIPATCHIHISISGAKLAAEVTAAVAAGQVFDPGKVSGSEAYAANDSAFTARFEVESFDAANYSDLLLGFSAALPAGSTVLMLDRSDNSYWSCSIDTPTQTLPLARFTRMGADEDYSLGGSEAFAGLFVVDFSRSACFDADALTVTLSGQKISAGSLAPTFSSSVTVYFEEVSFALENANLGEGLTQQLRYSFVSDHLASKWQGRNAALLLTPAADAAVPADAKLTVVTSLGTADYFAKPDGTFILPLEEVRSGTARITLSSALFPAARSSYTFRAQLLVSNTSEGCAPMNNAVAAAPQMPDVVFTKSADAAPSMKIVGEQVTPADVLSVEITSDVPDGAKIMAYVQQKAEDGYRDTAQGKQIAAGTDMPLISLRAYENDPGSYRLLVETEYDGRIVLSVPHYFIIR